MPRNYYIDSIDNQIKILKDTSTNIYKNFIFDNMNDAVRYKKTVYKTEFDDFGHVPIEDNRIKQLYQQENLIRKKESRLKELTSRLGDLEFFNTVTWKELESINKEWLDNTNKYKVHKFLYKERLADWLTKKTGKLFTAGSRDIELSITGQDLIGLDKFDEYSGFIKEITDLIKEYNKENDRLVKKYRLYLSENVTKKQETLISMYSEIRKEKIASKALRLAILSDCQNYTNLVSVEVDELTELDNIVYNDFYKSYNIYIKDDNRLFSVSYITSIGNRYILTDEKGRVYPNNSNFYIDLTMTGKAHIWDKKKQIKLFITDESIKTARKLITE